MLMKCIVNLEKPLTNCVLISYCFFCFMHLFRPTTMNKETEIDHVSHPFVIAFQQNDIEEAGTIPLCVLKTQN